MSATGIQTSARPIPLQLRAMTVADLPRVNGIVERAVMTWSLAERVKRLSLPDYRYHAHDFLHMSGVVAEDADGTLLGVAVWDAADTRDTPGGVGALMLHGLYVEPAWHRSGIGSRLLDAVADTARELGVGGVLVKAQADAAGFFAARGLRRLAVRDPGRDYPHRYWLPLLPAPAP